MTLQRQSHRERLGFIFRKLNQTDGCPIFALCAKVGSDAVAVIRAYPVDSESAKPPQLFRWTLSEWLAKICETAII